MMKPFLVFLLVATCQAIELFDTSSYEAMKEVELKNLQTVTQEEIFKMLKKEYPNEDPKLLQELANEFAVFVKAEVEFSPNDPLEFKIVDAFMLANNMLKNLEKAKNALSQGADSLPDSAKTFLDNFVRDLDELKEYNKENLYWEHHFDLIGEVLAYQFEYGIWEKLNDTLHRVIGHLSGKFSDLKDFFRKSIKAGTEKLQPHLINIKNLAKDVLANIGVLSRNAAQQAIEFFKPFAKQLGSLYIQLREKIHERFHNLAHPDTY